jgi:5,10-methylene-tetrahydrofolate dehydrogenase/methenyl tetrahydrofolate cyclohydrolase
MRTPVSTASSCSCRYVPCARSRERHWGGKQRAAEQPSTASGAAPLSHTLTESPLLRGVWAQLPKHINEKTVLEAISLDKDVDGFHPLNIGALSMKGRDPLFVACTPLGCMELLKRSGVQVYTLAPRALPLEGYKG